MDWRRQVQQKWMLDTRIGGTLKTREGELGEVRPEPGLAGLAGLARRPLLDWLSIVAVETMVGTLYLSYCCLVAQHSHAQCHGCQVDGG